jgi:hypothetical protein
MIANERKAYKGRRGVYEHLLRRMMGLSQYKLL